MGRQEVEVAIIGGSFSGASAALLLGNALRKTIVIDEGVCRNQRASVMHNVLGKEGQKIQAFFKQVREEIRSLANVTQKKGKVEKIIREGDVFQIFCKGGSAIFSKRILLATGVKDLLPKIPGIGPFWVKNVFQCPYCSGPDVKQRSLAVYSREEEAFFLSSVIQKWASQFTLLTDGASPLSRKEEKILDSRGVFIRSKKIIRFSGRPGKKIEVHFQGGEKESYRAIFFHLKSRLNSYPLIRKLGCKLTEKGLIAIDSSFQTSVPGVYAAGDAVESIQKISVAMGSGTAAAIAMDQDLSQ